MRPFLLMALMACAPETTPAQFAAPTPGFVLQWSGMPTRGGSISLTATLPPGAPSGAQVHMVLSDRGLGPGDCPSVLQGDCLDIDGNWYHVGSAMASGGTAQLSLTMPLRASSTVGAQAVVLAGSQAYLSSALEIPVQYGVLQEFDVCQGTWDACDVGLNCCPSCGSQFGCAATCVQPCPAGDPACLDGCWLYP